MPDEPLELEPAQHFEPDPKEGWRGKDLTEDELTTQHDLLAGLEDHSLEIAQEKEVPDGVVEPDES